MRYARRMSPGVAVQALAFLLLGLLLSGCNNGPAKPAHRERSSVRDGECREPGSPHAFFYPAENRVDYGPDDPKADGCTLLVPDHLFCCPDAPRPTDQ